MNLGQYSELYVISELSHRLQALGLKVQTEAPVIDAGVRLDALAETPAGQRIIIEVKGGHRALNDVLGSMEQVEKYARITDSAFAFVVTPLLSAAHPDVPNVVGLDGLEQAIRDILFKEGSAIVPNRYGGETELIEDEVPTLFVAMPFKPQFDDTFDVAIAGAAKSAGFVSERLDYEILDDLIIAEIHARIHSNIGVVADVTGANPNVMYELGYAKALEKPTVIISATPPGKLPFDIRGWQIVVYRFGQTKQLEKELVRRFRHIFGKT